MKLVLAIVLICASSFSMSAPEEPAKWINSQFGEVNFSYVKDLPPPTVRAQFPHRMLIEWIYLPADNMPSSAERERMDRLQELLRSAVEQTGLAVLVKISTGGGLRFWTYYAKSDAEFFEAMNTSLASEPRFPIIVHVRLDPLWKEYSDIRKDVE